MSSEPDSGRGINARHRGVLLSEHTLLPALACLRSLIHRMQSSSMSKHLYLMSFKKVRNSRPQLNTAIDSKETRVPLTE
jgi:hypothetical protein